MLAKSRKVIFTNNDNHMDLEEPKPEAKPQSESNVKFEYVTPTKPRKHSDNLQECHSNFKKEMRTASINKILSAKRESVLKKHIEEKSKGSLKQKDSTNTKQSIP